MSRAGAALLILGAIAGRLGPKLGTALAVLPLFAWFVLLAMTVSAGKIDGAERTVLAAHLVIGLLAFLLGSSLTSRFTSSRRSRPE